MAESLVLFESVINSRWFLRTSIILFLNKIDVFKNKLPKVRVRFLSFPPSFLPSLSCVLVESFMSSTHFPPLSLLTPPSLIR